MNLQRQKMVKIFMGLTCITVAFCYYSKFSLIETDYFTGKSLRFVIGVFHNLDTDSQADEEAWPQISKFRQRFLLWYSARPDIAAVIGPDTGTKASKYIIYRCDEGHLSYCGGWADRMKGMVAAYIIANLTGRNFKVDMLTGGCALTEYVIPHLVNWTLPTSFHRSLEKLPRDTKIVDIMDNRNLAATFSDVNFTNLIGDERFVYFKTNLYHNRGFKATSIYANELSWMKTLTHDQVMATVYKRLFVLHPRLQARLQTFLLKTLPTPEHKLICAHIRLGRNPTIPKDTAIRNVPENVFRVWEFIKQHSETDFHKVFIMADSTHTLQEANNQSFKSRIVVNPGPILHLELSKAKKSDFCRSENKVVFDQHVLMNCDVLMISNSGLSRLAAYVRGDNTGLYCFLTNGTVVPCRTRDVASLYKIRL